MGQLNGVPRKLRVGALIVSAGVPMGQVDTLLFRLRVGKIVQTLTKKICQLVVWPYVGVLACPLACNDYAIGKCVDVLVRNCYAPDSTGPVNPSFSAVHATFGDACLTIAKLG